MTGRFFSSDERYLRRLGGYTKKDGAAALAVYACVLAAYIGAAFLAVRTRFNPGIALNACVTAAVLLSAARGRHGLASVGISRRNLGRSVLAGLAAGAAAALSLRVLPSLLAGRRFAPLPSVLRCLPETFLAVSLAEELLFRGYIQTRLYGLVGQGIAAVPLTGILFCLVHLPFRIAGGRPVSAVQMAYILCMHVLLDFLCRKYDSLAAPVIAHGIIDWAGAFFL